MFTHIDAKWRVSCKMYNISYIPQSVKYSSANLIKWKSLDHGEGLLEQAELRLLQVALGSQALQLRAQSLHLFDEHFLLKTHIQMLKESKT